MQLSSRVAHRVDYRANLMLLSATGARMPIAAQTQNLSSGGLYVASDETCQTGTLFDFELPLPDASPRVRGRVAWVRNDNANGAGMGIEFVDLSRGDETLLRRTVKQLPPEPQEVRLYFENLAAPVRANGLISDDGVLSLTTRLPFLRLGSMVKICVRENEMQGQLRTASLKVDQKAQVPTLRIDLALDRSSDEALADTSGTIDTNDYTQAQPAPTIEPIPDAPSHLRPINVIDETTTPRASGRSYWGWASVAILAAGVAVGAYWISSSSTPSKPAVSKPAVSEPAIKPTPVNPTVSEPAATEPPTNASTAEPAVQPPPAIEAAPPAAVEPTAAGPNTAQDKPPATPSDTAATAEPSDFAINVQVSKSKARVVVQLEGPTEGIQSYPLASPPGVGIRLPVGTTVALGAGRHMIRKGPLNNLLVRDTSRGRLLLLFFRQGQQLRHEVTYPSGQLSIDVFADSSNP